MYIIVQYYFHVIVSLFGYFVIIVCVSLINMYYVLSLFVVDQFMYNVKCLELLKIRRYIKCPLLLLLLLITNVVINCEQMEKAEYHMY